MTPLGFLDWQGAEQPATDEPILVLTGEANRFDGLARGCARELVEAYGRNILAWRRDPEMPAIPKDGRWLRFPDDLPQPGQHVIAFFLDTIGWRALSIEGMSARRFDGPSKALCVYDRGVPFGTMIARVTMPGFPECSDAARWAPFAWRAVTTKDVRQISK